MKIRSIILLAAVPFAAAPRAPESNRLRHVQTIPLPNVEGRIDHMGVDVQAQRLFVAALGNNTVEVLDLGTGKRLLHEAVPPNIEQTSLPERTPRLKPMEAGTTLKSRA